MNTVPIAPITFADFLLKSGILKKTDNGYSGEYFTGGQSYASEFTPHEITQVDERLVDVVEALLASKYAERTNGLVYAKPLLLTLHHWNNPVPVLSSDKKRHYVVKVTGVSAMSYMPAYVKLWANAYTDVAITNGTPYVLNSRVLAFEVAKKELERHYPGWEKRYQVMQDLQTDSIETLQLVFTKPVKDVDLVSTFDMSAISFD
jgi:hypothetical protein